MHYDHLGHVPRRKVAIEGRGDFKHPIHVGHLGHIPRRKVATEGRCFPEHIFHVSHLGHISRRQVAIEGRGESKHCIHVSHRGHIPRRKVAVEGRGETKHTKHVSDLKDGFSSHEKIKVIAATNRPESLDPALLRSGRLDRKVELPHPGETARAQILKIHSKGMKVDLDDVNFEELARCTEDFNAAQLKAVATESGMIALRREATQIKHEDFMEAINVVAAKKKGTLDYYA